MRLFTDRRFLIACLLGAMPFVLVACFTEARGWAVTLLVVLGVLVVFGISAGDGRQPELSDTERFLSACLIKQGLAGAFRLDRVEHRVTPSHGTDSAIVNFKASVVITESLYQTTVPPADVCGALTPRRISSLCNLAARLVADGQAVSGVALPVAPTDPYARSYIEPRSQPGWSLALVGTARAVHAGQDGWRYQLTMALKELGHLAQAGQPRGAFADAIALDSSEGQQWLAETLAAWQKFEDELAAARASIDQHRARRGLDAIAAFFATHRVGSCFEGTGETMTQKIAPLPFWLELTALDAAQGTVHFTLRPERKSPHARRFSATLEHEPATGIIRLLARTSASDAAPHGGPLLSAAAAFTMEFVWESHGVPQLTGHGADFVLTLKEAGTDTAAGLRAALGLDREREIWNAVAPGTNYGGTFNIDGRELHLRLSFVPGTAPGALSAQIESEFWSGGCAVSRVNAEAQNDCDLVLEPAEVPASVAPNGEAVPDSWQRMFLRVEGRELLGTIQTNAGSVNVTLRC